MRVGGKCRDTDRDAGLQGDAVFHEWHAVDGAQDLIGEETIHPMLRALWAPRLLEAVDWIAGEVAKDRAVGRVPVLAEQSGEAEVAGVSLYGRVDRIDRLPDGSLAIVDYKTGKAPARKAVNEGFALQLGLLALIARAGGFGDIKGDPGAHEYWSMARKKGSFGYRQSADKDDGPEAFVERALAQFAAVADDYLLGGKEFKAKLNPTYAPWGDYDQLMRLEEWYGRD